MSALVVVETYFGNTRHLADVVANGLRSDGIDTVVVTVEDAPTQLDDGIEPVGDRRSYARPRSLHGREPPSCLHSAGPDSRPDPPARSHLMPLSWLPKASQEKAGRNSRISSWPGRTTPAEDSGTSFHAPRRSRSGSDTTNRASSLNR